VSVPGIVVAVFDHVTIRVPDRAASERFYTTVLGTLGVGPTYAGVDPDGNNVEAVSHNR
jgi:catechol 2,3-dioxygenase-like lactoylglutathione lyase family enzyme